MPVATPTLAQVRYGAGGDLCGHCGAPDGAGIMVDGVYAAHAMNREHVRGIIH